MHLNNKELHINKMTDHELLIRNPPYKFLKYFECVNSQSL